MEIFFFCIKLLNYQKQLGQSSVTVYTIYFLHNLTMFKDRQYHAICLMPIILGIISSLMSQNTLSGSFQVSQSSYNISSHFIVQKVKEVDTNVC